MKDNGRILAVGAHPDDIEFNCVGVLARLKAKGYHIVMATLTPGDCGSLEYSSQEIMTIRRNEARAAAELLGAEYYCLEERDLAIDYNTATRREVTRLLRTADPFLVLTHPLNDYMMDHEITGRLVRDACFGITMPNFGVPGGEKPTTGGVPYLYYWDYFGQQDMYGDPVPVDILIDITDTIEMKEKMLACHESQRNWLRDQHGMDEYLESMRRAAAARGAQLGVQYAEGFRQHRGHPYPADNILVKILEQ